MKRTLSLLGLVVIFALAGCNGGGGTSTGFSSPILNTPPGRVLPTGAATLVWSQPTQLTDGSPIPGGVTENKIYYGTSSGIYTDVVTVPLSSLTIVGTQVQFTVTGLTLGQKYYFVVTAVDGNGNEGAFSNQVSKQL